MKTMRATHLALVGVLAGTGSLTTACRDIVQPAAPAAPAAAVRATVTTIGVDLDPDGYGVRVDEGSERAIGTNATVTIADIPAGDHAVRLAGVAANCPVGGANPRAVTIAAGDTADVAFAVVCTALTGSVNVTTATSGADVDPDGYSVSVDGGSARAIGTNGAITIAGLPPGDHVIRFDGPAANCTVDSPNPRTVTVIAGAVSNVAFRVACTALSGGAAFASVSAGQAYSCGVTIDGAAYCWGNNAYGQLGNGSTNPSTTPVPVDGGLVFASLSVGWGFTCGLTTGGGASCWGGDYGPRPAPVGAGLTFTSLTIGGWGFVCGLTAGGAAYCWGVNSEGEFGDGTTTSSPTPVRAGGGMTFMSLSAGLSSACGVALDGTAYCWGRLPAAAHPELCQVDDMSGEMFCTRPMAVPSEVPFTQVSAGEGFYCGLTPDGAAYCWGWYPGGESNAGSVAVPGLLRFATLSVGAQRACGVASNGSAYCWGWIPIPPPGELRNSPTLVQGGTIFAAASVGLLHACGVTPDGAAYCWGVNSNGELGDGSQTNSLVPVKVTGPR